MAATEVAAQKLGKLPVRTDVRTLSLARYAEPAELPAPPHELDLAEHVPGWPLYGNDEVGNCAVAAAAHLIEVWTSSAHNRPIELTEGAVEAAFDRVKLFDPATGEEGAVELDVLRDWRTHGIGHHRIAAYARVRAHDHRLVRVAAYLFGGLYVGLQLPRSAQRQEVWDWNGSLAADDRPGSWGGHAVAVVGYSARALTVVSWDTLQVLTWSFWNRYCDEAYCILSHDFLAGGRAPNGFDLNALRADLALVTA